MFLTHYWLRWLGTFCIFAVAATLANISAEGMRSASDFGFFGGVLLIPITLAVVWLGIYLPWKPWVDTLLALPEYPDDDWLDDDDEDEEPAEQRAGDQTI